MKYILLVAFIGFFSGNSLSPRQEKKMVRMIENVWELPDLEIVEIKYKTTESMFDRGHYFVIKASDKVVGYAVGRKIQDSYLNYFPFFVFNTNYEVALAGILEMNTLKGAEINSKRWLKQFKGFRGGTMKYGQTIDAVSGATLSGISMVKEVKLMQKLVSNYKYIETGLVIGQ